MIQFLYFVLISWYFAFCILLVRFLYWTFYLTYCGFYFYHHFRLVFLINSLSLLKFNFESWHLLLLSYLCFFGNVYVFNCLIIFIISFSEFCVWTFVYLVSIASLVNPWGQTYLGFYVTCVFWLGFAYLDFRLLLFVVIIFFEEWIYLS